MMTNFASSRRPPNPAHASENPKKSTQSNPIIHIKFTSQNQQNNKFVNIQPQTGIGFAFGFPKTSFPPTVTTRIIHPPNKGARRPKSLPFPARFGRTNGIE
jgi:hypothetical protein